jgi:two-component system, OmpR family, sensor histidine kinase MprB
VSFRKRLTLLCAGAIALVLTLGSGATYLIVRGQLRDEVDASLAQQSKAVVIYAQDGDVIERADDAATELPPPPKNLGQRIQVAAPAPAFGSLPSYVEVIDSRGKAAHPPAGRVNLPVSNRAIEIARTGRGSFYDDVHVRGTHLRMRVAPVGKHRALLLAQSLSDVDTALNRLAWSLGITGGIGILIAALVGAAVARGALRPVRELTATAERISETRDLAERIEIGGEDELGRLGATFNTMLDSLEGALRSQRRLVADASHELRTPLTSLRTNIDVLRQGSALGEPDRERLLADVGEEIDELTALVGNLVDLARGSQRDLHLHPVRLDEIAQVVVRRAKGRFPEFDFALEAEPTTVWGDPQELERAIWNLVENAAKWSNGEDRVEIEVGGGRVSVRDHGPGVLAADRPFVFDRFYRSESARGRPGSGLGLAIVRQVAENHGGGVDVEDAPGGGARFRLTLLEGA